jgi:hypothetical protein
VLVDSKPEVVAVVVEAEDVVVGDGKHTLLLMVGIQSIISCTCTYALEMML